jgi:hypothetical protein
MGQEGEAQLGAATHSLQAGLGGVRASSMVSGRKYSEVL